MFMCVTELLRLAHHCRPQVQAALAEVEGYHAVEGSLQSKQLLGEARGNLSKMNHISHIRCGACRREAGQEQGLE